MISRCLAVSGVLFLGLVPVYSQTPLSEKEKVIVCRAFAAAFSHNDISAVSGEINPDGTAYVWYQRRSDGTMWDYECKFEGNEVIWAALGENGRGRWRAEEKNIFSITDSTVTIKQMWSDGSTSVSEFNYK